MLAVVGLTFGSFYLTPSTSASSPQFTCTGTSVEGWPCGYTGPFVGEYYAGSAAVGCTPAEGDSTCIAPQIIIRSSFLVIRNASYVIVWANQSLQPDSGILDGSNISVSGNLAKIFYNRTAGSTHTIYSSNAKGLWTPQPQYEIQNATLSPQRINSTCTTTLTFTVTGPPNGVLNLPMIPAGSCYTVRNETQSPILGSMNTPVIILASAIGVVIAVCALVLMKKRKKESAQ